MGLLSLAVRAARARPRLVGGVGAAAGAGGGLAAGRAIAQEPSDQEDLQRAVRRRQEIEDMLRRIDSVDLGDPESVLAAQQVLATRGSVGAEGPDGAWGDETRRTAARVRAELQEELSGVTALEEAARARVDRARSEAQFREITSSPEEQLTRELVPTAAGIAATLGGHIMRSGARIGPLRLLRGAVGNDAARFAAMEPRARELTGGGKVLQSTVSARMSDLNDYWRMAGSARPNNRGGGLVSRVLSRPRSASRDPFLLDPSAPQGVAPNPNGAQLSELAQEIPTGMRANDWGWTAAGVGDAAVGTALERQALSELENAQRAYDAEKTPQNATRLENAHQQVMVARTMQRAGAGFAFGRLTGAATHPYSREIPRMREAERDAAELLRFLNKQPRGSSSLPRSSTRRTVNQRDPHWRDGL